MPTQATHPAGPSAAQLERQASGLKAKEQFEQGFRKVLTLLNRDSIDLQTRLTAMEAAAAHRRKQDASTQTELDAQAMAGPVAMLDRLKCLEQVVLRVEGSGFVGSQFAFGGDLATQPAQTGDSPCSSTDCSAQSSTADAAGGPCSDFKGMQPGASESDIWSEAKCTPPDVLKVIKRGRELEAMACSPLHTLAERALLLSDEEEYTPHHSNGPVSRWCHYIWFDNSRGSPSVILQNWDFPVFPLSLLEEHKI